MLDRALPSGVRGPVDFRALARFAASITRLMIGRLRKDNLGALSWPAPFAGAKLYHRSLRTSIVKI